MKETGKMIRVMEKELSNMQMEMSIKDTGNMIRNMEKELSNMQMEHIQKEYGQTETI